MTRITSSALAGIDAIPVSVEVTLAAGMPSFHLVGLPTLTTREVAVRIRSALDRVGHWPDRKITIQVPADAVRGQTSTLDLPIAVAILIAEGRYPPDALDRILIRGELGLDGSLRPMRGALASTMLARDLGLRGILLPAESAGEALEVGGIDIYGVKHLSEVIAAMGGKRALPLARRRPRPSPPPTSSLDMSDVRGNAHARAAIEVAAAGGHNVLLMGPPAICKTMLARRFTTILPPLAPEDALETTKVYSALGPVNGLVTERPFRAPHHSVSAATLVGGSGSPPRPGEVSLAHHGVLFLDELPEFSHLAIDALRQPLADRSIACSWNGGVIRLPASFLLMATASPCPCGWSGSRRRACTCSPGMIERYRTRMSAALLDRFDVQVTMEPKLGHLRDAPRFESSAAIRDRVVEARERQRRRLARFGLRTNAEMTPAASQATCVLDADAEAVLDRVCQVYRDVSASAIAGLIKVARTIADLAGRDDIDGTCMRRATAYRGLDDERLE